MKKKLNPIVESMYSRYTIPTGKNKRQTLKESMQEIDRKYFASLNKEGDGHYYILVDGNYEKDFYADSDEEAKKKFQQYLRKNESLSLKESESIRYCSHCDSKVDIDDCDTDSFWTNYGDRVVYHVCPVCGESVEDFSLDDGFDDFNYDDDLDESLTEDFTESVTYNSADEIDFSRPIEYMYCYGEDGNGDWDKTDAIKRDGANGTYYEVNYNYYESGFGRTDEHLENSPTAELAADKIFKFAGGPVTVEYGTSLAESLSLKEDWTHFEFTSGSNPYIATTEKEKNRMLRKYKGRIQEVKPGFYKVDDRNL